MAVPTEARCQAIKRNRAEHSEISTRAAPLPPPKLIGEGNAEQIAALGAFNAAFEAAFHDQFVKPERREVAD